MNDIFDIPEWTGIRYLDKEGNPLTLMRWGELFESDYRFHLRAFIGSYSISTFWLGLIHLDGSYWETMVAKNLPDGEMNVISLDRHSSKEEAEQFHQKMIDQYAYEGYV